MTYIQWFSEDLGRMPEEIMEATTREEAIDKMSVEVTWIEEYRRARDIVGSLNHTQVAFYMTLNFPSDDGPIEPGVWYEISRD